MSAPKHTPGPWFWDDLGDLLAPGNGPPEHAQLASRIGASDADAALIAAAPDLLGALEELLSVADPESARPMKSIEDGLAALTVLERAKAAIAKARGGA